MDQVRQYQNRKGEKRYAPLAAYAEELSDDSMGFCVRCGTAQEDVEPDATRYECHCCGQSGVYGIEELALMGLIR